MTRSEENEFQTYYSRVRPIYPYLINLAYAVGGTMDQAQYCLQCALLDVWLNRDSSASRHGLRESLRRAVVRAALRCPTGDSPDWDALRPEDESTDVLLRALSQETTPLRRILVLKYGSRLSNRQIAGLMHIESRRVRQLLQRFEARAARRLSVADQRRFDVLMQKRIHALLQVPDPAAPDMNNVFRAFEADAAAAIRPGRLPLRIVRGVLCVLLALVCMLVFWLAAVLVQPEQISGARVAKEPIEAVSGQWSVVSGQ